MGFLKTKADYLWLNFGYAASDLYTARNHLYYAGDNIAAQNWSAAKDSLYQAANYFGYVGGHLHGTNDVSDNIFDALYWIEDNWPEVDGDPYVLTMQKIMDEIWLSSPLETFFFVNYIDAMRAAIWNKEISAEKLHELYRHFSI